MSPKPVAASRCVWTSKRNQLQFGHLRPFCHRRCVWTSKRNQLQCIGETQVHDFRCVWTSKRNQLQSPTRSSFRPASCVWTSKRNQLQLKRANSIAEHGCVWTSKRNQLQYLARHSLEITGKCLASTLQNPERFGLFEPCVPVFHGSNQTFVGYQAGPGSFTRPMTSTLTRRAPAFTRLEAAISMNLNCLFFTRSATLPSKCGTRVRPRSSLSF